MAQNHNLVSVVDVGLVQSRLLQRTSIDQVNLLKPRNRVPYLRVNLLASSLIWLSSDDDNLLQLVLFEVLHSQRHDKAFDR